MMRFSITAAVLTAFILILPLTAAPALAQLTRERPTHGKPPTAAPIASGESEALQPPSAAPTTNVDVTTDGGADGADAGGNFSHHRICSCAPIRS